MKSSRKNISEMRKKYPQCSHHRGLGLYVFMVSGDNWSNIGRKYIIFSNKKKQTILCSDNWRDITDFFKNIARSKI